MNEIQWFVLALFAIFKLFGINYKRKDMDIIGSIVGIILGIMLMPDSLLIAFLVIMMSLYLLISELRH